MPNFPHSWIPELIAAAGPEVTETYIDFFTSTIRNRNARAAYARACWRLFDWCAAHGLELMTVRPFHVAAWIEDFPGSKPTVKQKLAAGRLIRESNTRSDSLQQLVADVMEEFKRGQNPLVISPIHRDGKAFAQSLRASMKAEGMLGQEDHQIAWLESVDLSAAQQRDPIYYEPGQIIEFHRQREKGGFRCGDHWEVTRREDQAVFVAKTVRKGSCLCTWRKILMFTGPSRCPLRSASAC